MSTAQSTIYNVNHRYTFTGSLTGKDANRQQAIIDTICYLGWMSLKDSEHNASGINAAASKRILREAVETRKAAETLLSDGTITIMGTWSNGIAVGPGPAFAHIDHSAQPVIVKSNVSSNRARVVKHLTVATHTEAEVRAETARAEALQVADEMAARNEKERIMTDVYCPIKYAEGATCPVTLAWDTIEFGNRHGITDSACEWQPAPKPRVRYTWPVAPQTPAQDDADTIADAAISAITGEEYSAPQTIPTPIRPAAPYVPAVGDTVFCILRHEDGRTTDRVIDVQRVGNGMFRGYDRRYKRTRNYEMVHVAHIERWDGLSVYGHNGEEVVAAA